MMLFQTNEKGQVVTKTSLLKQMEELIEEPGLTCCICREGYKFQARRSPVTRPIIGACNLLWKCSVSPAGARGPPGGPRFTRSPAGAQTWTVSVVSADWVQKHPFSDRVSSLSP